MSFFSTDTSHEESLLFTDEVKSEIISIASQYENIQLTNVYIPLGWKDLVAEFLKSLANFRGDKVARLAVLNGTFDPVVRINYGRSYRIPYELMHDFRNRSIGKCFKCGRDHSKRRIIGDSLFYLCRNCHEELDASGVTGTWLDRI